MTSRSDRLTLTAFLLVAVLAGGNAVGIRFSNRELDPLWGAGLRFAGAATILLVAMAVMRLPFPRNRNLFGATLYGLLGFAAAFSLAYYGFQELHAGFGQILLALVPLLTLLLAVLERQEVFKWAAAGGGILALAGVAVMSQGALRESIPIISLLALVGSATCFAQAGIVVAWIRDVHPITMNAVGMAVAAIVLLGASFIAGETHVMPDLAETQLALGYLIVIGSVVVFVLNVFVIRQWGPSRASYILVLIPVFTIAYSVWLLDEPVGWELIAGGALVLAGVYVGALRHTQTDLA